MRWISLYSATKRDLGSAMGRAAGSVSTSMTVSRSSSRLPEQQPSPRKQPTEGPLLGDPYEAITNPAHPTNTYRHGSDGSTRPGGLSKQGYICAALRFRSV